MFSIHLYYYFLYMYFHFNTFSFLFCSSLCRQLLQATRNFSWCWARVPWGDAQACCSLMCASAALWRLLLWWGYAVCECQHTHHCDAGIMDSHHHVCCSYSYLLVILLFFPQQIYSWSSLARMCMGILLKRLLSCRLLNTASVGAGNAQVYDNDCFIIS